MKSNTGKRNTKYMIRLIPYSSEYEVNLITIQKILLLKTKDGFYDFPIYSGNKDENSEIDSGEKGISNIGLNLIKIPFDGVIQKEICNITVFLFVIGFGE